MNYEDLLEQAPSLLFDLVGLQPQDDYAFESIEVHETVRRIDGVLKPRHGSGPNIFVEFRGYDDPNIYWRLYTEVSLWYQLNRDKQRPAVLVVLFLDKRLDPGPPDVLVPA